MADARLASSGRRLGVDLAASSLDDAEARPPMDSPISLRYPNGRVHETTLSTSGGLNPGDRFELYGRHWDAVRVLEPSRWRTGQERRMLCLPTSELCDPRL
jgi:hypothetical protein